LVRETRRPRGRADKTEGSRWLIFALLPAELAVHPADARAAHELYLMVDDVGACGSTTSRPPRGPDPLGGARGGPAPPGSRPLRARDPL